MSGLWRRVIQSLRTPPDPTTALPEMQAPWWDAHGAEVGAASFRKVLRRLPQLSRDAVTIAWRASRADTVGVLVLNLTAAATSAFGLLATQPILSALLAGGPTFARLRAALPALLVVGAATAAQALLSSAATWCQLRLEPLVQREVYQRLFRLTSAVPLAAFDDAGFADEMRRARDRGVDASGRLVNSMVDLSTSLVHLAAAAAALLVLQPVLLPALVVAAAPRAWAAIRDARRWYASMNARITLDRRLWLLGDLMARTDTAAELRSHQIGPWLMREFQQLQHIDTAADLRLARLQTTATLAGDAVSGVASAGVYVLLGALLVLGGLPLAAAGTALLIVANARTSLYTSPWPYSAPTPTGSTSPTCWASCVAPPATSPTRTTPPGRSRRRIDRRPHTSAWTR